MDLVILSIFIVKIPFPKNLKLVDDERYYKNLSFNGFRLSRHFKNCNKPWRNFFENVVLSKNESLLCNRRIRNWACTFDKFRHYGHIQQKIPEACLIVPDFTIFAYLSSCHFISFSVPFSLLCLYF